MPLRRKSLFSKYGISIKLYDETSQSWIVLYIIFISTVIVRDYEFHVNVHFYHGLHLVKNPASFSRDEYFEGNDLSRVSDA